MGRALTLLSTPCDACKIYFGWGISRLSILKELHEESSAQEPRFVLRRRLLVRFKIEAQLMRDSKCDVACTDRTRENVRSEELVTVTKPHHLRIICVVH